MLSKQIISLSSHVDAITEIYNYSFPWFLVVIYSEQCLVFDLSFSSLIDCWFVLMN